MFKLNRVVFRVIVKPTEESAIGMKKLLNSCGIKVVDLRQSTIQDKTTGEALTDVFIMCCEGRELLYLLIKRRGDFREFMYEGYKTLM